MKTQLIKTGEVNEIIRAESESFEFDDEVSNSDKLTPDQNTENNTSLNQSKEHGVAFLHLSEIESESDCVEIGPLTRSSKPKKEH